jgi:signal transduction histidine kinase
MKLTVSENVRWYALVGGLVATLVLLVVLQYRSVKAVSVTMREQMRANLGGSLMDVREAFDRELSPLCRELQQRAVPPGEDNLHELALGFDDWRSGAAHPSLVEAVYVWKSNRNSPSEMLKLDASGKAFEAVSWPENLIQLREKLVEMMDARAPDERDHFDHHAGDRGPNGPMGPPSWMIDQDVPALVHPIFTRSLHNADEYKADWRDDSSMEWIMIVLDRTVLAQNVLPELIQRYFGVNGQSSYEIAVIDKNERAPALYVSDPHVNGLGFRGPDAALNLFGRPAPSLAPGEHSSAGMFVALPPSPEHTNPEHGADHRGEPPLFAGPNPDEGPPSLMVQPIHYPLGQEWEIVARHRLGSVDAAVAALSHRNLAFNLGVVAVLAATMAMIIVASVRARRFGQLQMDFVANVSHELRTPLTGIVSAAQNMADGLIEDKQKVATYGKAIIQQAQQLSELVEQILQFSAIQKNGNRYQFQRVDVAEIVQFALENTSSLIQSANIKVEQQIESELPTVWADFKALSRCLQNLIGNAVKYGGYQRWIGIRAWMADGSNNGKEICISVADKGIGIRPEDLGHIFKPFYRASEVAEAQIRGTGLGLPLARKIAEAMGGAITVTSQVGKGSEFTVHLPQK